MTTKITADVAIDLEDGNLIVEVSIPYADKSLATAAMRKVFTEATLAAIRQFCEEEED